MSKYLLQALVLILLAASPGAAFSYDEITFDDTDESALEVMDTLPQQFPEGTPASFVELIDGGPDYLFVMPVDKCGAADCTIIGFEKISDGWVKIYEVFGGDGLKILETKTQDHRDIQQYESQEDSDFIIKTSKWNIDKYDPPVISKPERN